LESLSNEITKARYYFIFFLFYFVGCAMSDSLKLSN